MTGAVKPPQNLPCGELLYYPLSGVTRRLQNLMYLGGGTLRVPGL